MMAKWLTVFLMMVTGGMGLGVSLAANKDKFDNIDGTFAVKFNWHYSNKTSVTWGQNSQKDFAVKISLSPSAATYDCTNTTSYSCEDSAYMFDWNKLWGKARCGYTHDHHEDSDRFVFRKCSDASCSAYDGTSRIQIGAYSYDGGVAPYTGQDPGLLKTFKTTIAPDQFYVYELLVDDTGLSTFVLKSADNVELERQTVQHKTLCVDNYYEGTVQGLYFGGTCKAPVEIVAQYQPV